MTGQEQRDELTMQDRGRWLVTTTTIAYAFNLRIGAVETFDDDGIPHPLHGHHSLRLQAIDVLRVGEPGRWWMRRPGDGIHGLLRPFVSEPVTAIASVAKTETAGAAAGLSSLGPAYTAETMRWRLSVEEAVLDAWVADRRVLQVVPAPGRRVFPEFQLADDGTTLPGLDTVLGELADGIDDDGWTAWLWLTGRPAYAGGCAIWELLRDGDVDTVVRAAARAAWVWRQ